MNEYAQIGAFPLHHSASSQVGYRHCHFGHSLLQVFNAQLVGSGAWKSAAPDR